jgi:hypothetical protein
MRHACAKMDTTTARIVGRRAIIAPRANVSVVDPGRGLRCRFGGSSKNKDKSSSFSPSASFEDVQDNEDDFSGDA